MLLIVVRKSDWPTEAVLDPDQRRSLTGRHEKVPAATVRPAFEEMFVDDEGGFWVKEYTLPGTESKGRWRIYHDGGRTRTPR